MFCKANTTIQVRSPSRPTQMSARMIRRTSRLTTRTYSGGDPASEPEEGGGGETLVHAAAPTVRRPYLNVICGATRDSVRLGRYDHARRPYAGPGMLAAQIEERRAELAFLRTVWPQVPTQPAGVAPESGARTDDEALGGVESQGVAQGPMVDTDTAGTVECEV